MKRNRKQKKSAALKKIHSAATYKVELSNIYLTGEFIKTEIANKSM
jgi:hypothetical protein